MILPVQRIRPVGKSLFCQGQIFSRPALGQPLKVPSLPVRMPDHDQRHTLSLPERQGHLWFEQAFFVVGFDNSHRRNHTT